MAMCSRQTHNNHRQGRGVSTGCTDTCTATEQCASRLLHQVPSPSPAPHLPLSISGDCQPGELGLPLLTSRLLSDTMRDRLKSHTLTYMHRGTGGEQ